jgi:hypothetical protein
MKCKIRQTKKVMHKFGRAVPHAETAPGALGSEKKMKMIISKYINFFRICDKTFLWREQLNSGARHRKSIFHDSWSIATAWRRKRILGDAACRG